VKRLLFILLLSFFLTGCGNQVTEFSASNPKIATQGGIRNATGELQASGKAGFLVYGPYIELKPGTYQLAAKGRLAGSATPLATLDVVAEKGQRTLVLKPIYADAQMLPDAITTVMFDVDKLVTDAEFRILVQEQTTGIFKGYELTKLGDKK
jgi:hypothetical protein